MLITVHCEISPWDAHIIAGRLRAEGLHPSLMSEHHVRVAWRLAVMLGGVRIQVPLTEADDACKVLDDWRAGLYQEAMEDQLGLPSTVCCRRCLRSDWVPVRDTWSRLLACVTVVLWRISFVPEIIGQRCRACGYVEHFGNLAEDIESRP